MVNKNTNMNLWIKTVTFSLVPCSRVFGCVAGEGFSLSSAVGKTFTEVLFPFQLWILKTPYDLASKKKITETIPGVCYVGCIGYGQELFVSHCHTPSEIN